MQTKGNNSYMFDDDKSILDVLFYEFYLFTFSFTELKHLDEYKDGESMQSIFIEIFLLHARNLLNFFCSEKKYETDLSCTDFIDSNGKKIILFNKDKELIERMNWHLSHMTNNRLTGKPGWNILKIKEDMVLMMDDFLSNIDENKYFPTIENRKKSNFIKVLSI